MRPQLQLPHQLHPHPQVQVQVQVLQPLEPEPEPEPQPGLHRTLGKLRSQLALALRLSAHSVASGSEDESEDWAGLFRELCRHSHRNYLDLPDFRAAVRREAQRHPVPLGHQQLADEVDQIWMSVATPTGAADAVGCPDRRLGLADFIRLLSDCPAAALRPGSGVRTAAAVAAYSSQNNRRRKSRGVANRAGPSRLTMCW